MHRENGNNGTRTGERRKNLILINEELKKNERILAGAEELSRVGGWEYELESGEIWHSDQNHRNFGYEPGAFPSKIDFFLNSIVHSDFVKVFRRAFDKIRETGEPVELDFKARLKSGEVHLFRSLCKARKDQTGNVTAIYGATMDITDQKAVEKALFESELKYRKLFNQAADTIFLIDPHNAEIIEFNEKAHKSLGYSRHEFKKMRLSDIECETSLEKMKDHIEKILETGSHIFETRHKKKNGEIRDMVVSATAINIRGKKLLQSIHYDITERKKAEEELNRFRFRLEEMVRERTRELHETNERLNKEAEERLRAEEALRNSERDLRSIIDNMQDTFYRTDSNGCFTMLSTSVLDLTGFKPKELLGSQVSDLYVKPKEREIFIKKLEESGGRLTSFETVIRGKNGLPKWVSTSARFYNDSRGNIAGVEGIVRDITERKRMEEEIIKAQRLESIGVLAGGIAHDFNNILTGILSNIEFLKEYIGDYAPLDDSISQILDGAESAVERATKLTRQLLTFSKGGDPLLETAYISVLLKEATEFSLRGTNLKHQCYIPDDIWPVEMDKNQMTQVINNLLINARHAMPDGGVICIRAGNEHIDMNSLLPLPEGRYIKFSISDTGEGILPENIGRIFDPYFTTKGVGTGLGLATSYSIIKRHKGHIEVESRPKQGSTFHIYLPASANEPVSKLKRNDFPVMSGNAKILLMEDEDIVANSFKILVNKLGYEITRVKDGREAIKLFEKTRKEGIYFDVLIMDLTVPGGMGGAEAIQKLLKIDPTIKAIVCSGYSEDDVMSNFRKYGFCATLQKPFSKQALLQVLSEVLKG